MRSAAVYAAALAALATAVPALAVDDILREGTGSRREALNEMELQKFSTDMLAGLTNWTNGEALTAESIAGKVVLIATFASWNPTSIQELSKTQRLHRRHADEGLIVLAVHHPTGWEQAAAKLDEKKVEHLVAHDADGKVRGALKVDQDPDYYFIDRAGHLRYADVRSEAVSDAVKKLLAESVEDAQAVPGAVQGAMAATLREARKARDVTSTVKPGDRVDVEYEAPDDSAYENARWPWRGLMLGKAEYDSLAERVDHEPPSFELPEDNYYGTRPEPHGRLLVIYLFDPTRATSTGIVPRMNQIQSRYYADVDVVGIAANFGERFNNMQGEEAEKVVERNTKAVERHFKDRELNHAILLAPPNTDQLYQNSNSVPITRSDNPNSWGWAFIISTDGKARYGGHPDWDSFEKNIQELLKVDPAVKARRKAEEALRKPRGR